jgi:hypothetical protein
MFPDEAWFHLHQKVSSKKKKKDTAVLLIHEVPPHNAQTGAWCTVNVKTNYWAHILHGNNSDRYSI